MTDTLEQRAKDAAAQAWNEIFHPTNANDVRSPVEVLERHLIEFVNEAALAKSPCSKLGHRMSDWLPLHPEGSRTFRGDGVEEFMGVCAACQREQEAVHAAAEAVKDAVRAEIRVRSADLVESSKMCWLGSPKGLLSAVDVISPDSAKWLARHDAEVAGNALEMAAQVADGHWPESGHVQQEDAVSCPMSISIQIRRLKSGVKDRLAALEKEAEGKDVQQ